MSVIVTQEEIEAIRQLVADRIVATLGPEPGVVARFQSDDAILASPEATIVMLVGFASTLVAAGRSIPATLEEIERKVSARANREPLGTQCSTLRSYVRLKMASEHGHGALTDEQFARAWAVALTLHPEVATDQQ